MIYTKNSTISDENNILLLTYIIFFIAESREAKQYVSLSPKMQNQYNESFQSISVQPQDKTVNTQYWNGKT